MTGSRSTSQMYVSGCLTLNVWWNRTSEASEKRRISHAGFAPFGCPLTGSSSGVYTTCACSPESGDTSTAGKSRTWSSGLPGNRVTAPLAITAPLRSTSDTATSCHFSPAIRSETLTGSAVGSSDTTGAAFRTSRARSNALVPPSSSVAVIVTGYVPSSPMVHTVESVIAVGEVPVK
ncbi:MAG: hypothetical protein E6K13_09420 [Methanobacteriota archaeon]|nr:MAG: hypothetical protein E6K13_09420 [Euryarchaeota archaeon]